MGGNPYKEKDMTTKLPMRVFSPDGTISLYFPVLRKEDGSLTLSEEDNRAASLLATQYDWEETNKEEEPKED